MRQAWLLFAVLALTAGCNRPPRAPALRDEPVYSNQRDGLSFLSPEGWLLTAKSDPPNEISERDRLLVCYQSPAATLKAWFELSRADWPESTDVPARLALPSHASGTAWQPSGNPQPEKVGDTEGTRYTFTNQERIKESTVVRRGPHLYFFTVISEKTDQQARQQIRKIIADARWTK
jgi:hypothetical protein